MGVAYIGRRNVKRQSDTGVVEVNDDRPWGYEEPLNQESNDATLAVCFEENGSFRQEESGL